MNPNDHISQNPIPTDVTMPTQQELHIAPLKAKAKPKDPPPSPPQPQTQPVELVHGEGTEESRPTVTQAEKVLQTVRSPLPPVESPRITIKTKGATKCIYFRDPAQLDEFVDIVSKRGSAASSIMVQLVAAFLKAYKAEEDKETNRAISVSAFTVWL